jgi:hypothetical protein
MRKLSFFVCQVTDSSRFGENKKVTTGIVVLGCLVVSLLATGSKVCGLKPRPMVTDFKGVKNRQHAFLRRGNKAVGLMS